MNESETRKNRQHSIEKYNVTLIHYEQKKEKNYVE